MKKNTPRLLKTILISLALVFLAIQIVPYGRNQKNPPVVREPTWASAPHRDLARRACFDCHSHETAWPWYSRVAPISWLVFRDVVEGREELNFSDWRGGGREGEKAGEMREQVLSGEMPPLMYRLGHPGSRLTEAEKRQLVEGLTALK